MIVDDKHKIDSDKVRFESWEDDEGNVYPLENGLEDIPEEQLESELDSLEDFKHFVRIEDENVRVSDIDPRYFNEEGGMILKAPSKLSWGAIAAIGAICVNLLFAGSALYYTQTGFNKEIQRELETIQKNQVTLSENVYTKREEELRYANLKLDLKKQDEEIKRLRNRTGN